MSQDKSLQPRVDAPFQPSEPAPALRPAQHFSDTEAEFIADPSTDEPPLDGLADEEVITSVLRPRKSLWRRLLLIAVLLLILSVVAQAGHWLWDAWQHANWFALGGTLSLLLVMVAGVGSLIGEWRKLWKLRHRAQQRDQAAELLNSHGTVAGRDFCEQLAASSGLDSSHPSYRRWKSALEDQHNDQEVIKLYDAMVMPLADKQARQKISRYAAESTLMIAVSPLALADMLFIGWRNIRMINQIARIYGIELGYFSRIRLLRGVLFNIAFAGVTELVREVGLDWMSQDLMARLSGRAAQGIGAGLLTARLGLKAMELCRPIPWQPGEKPRLGDFRSELIDQLGQALKKKPAVSADTRNKR